MTRAERRAFLRARGWERISADTWRAPEGPSYRFYSLAAATYAALERQLAEGDPS
jgi:hypothetical protein